ncbi:MAG: acetate uptake transporter family protein [Christensenellaceae bacterium]
MEQEQQKKSVWANPTPAGLVALAVACFLFFAMLTGQVEASAAPLMGIWLLAGFVVQLIVGVLDLKAGNGVGGNAFFFFAAFFMLVGGLEFLYKWQAGSMGMSLDARIDGWAWIVLTLTMWLWTVAFLKSPFLLTAILLCVDVALPFIALADLGVIAKSMTAISGWALLLAGVIAVYFAGALMINDAFSKKVLPVPGPLVK